MPAASAAMGTRLVEVRPGPVLTSRMRQVPSGARMASVREMSRQPRARWAAWAASRQRSGRWLDRGWRDPELGGAVGVTGGEVVPAFLGADLDRWEGGEAVDHREGQLGAGDRSSSRTVSS
jgi:hypothetical protein